MDYTKLLYVLIGERIKRLRKERKLRLDDLNVDRSHLSKIERGIADKKRNPYLLSVTLIHLLSQQFGISPSELVWGNQQEREQFIKFITVGVLINNVDSAFYDLEIKEWIENEWEYLPEVEIKALLNQLSDMEIKYGFFVNKKNWNYYNVLATKYDSGYEMLSNLLLHLLVQDYEFSNKFFEHLINYANCTSDDEDRVKQVLKNYITYCGNYSVIILDKNGIDYPKFVVAFEKMWLVIREEYMNFFNENLFLSDEELLMNGLLTTRNNKIRSLLISEQFIGINRRLSLFSEYDNREAIVSSLNMRYKMIYALQENEYLFSNDKEKVIEDFFSVL